MIAIIGFKLDIGSFVVEIMHERGLDTIFYSFQIKDLIAKTSVC